MFGLNCALPEDSLHTEKKSYICSIWFICIWHSFVLCISQLKILLILYLFGGHVWSLGEAHVSSQPFYLLELIWMARICLFMGLKTPVRMVSLESLQWFIPRESSFCGVCIIKEVSDLLFCRPFLFKTLLTFTSFLFHGWYLPFFSIGIGRSRSRKGKQDQEAIHFTFDIDLSNL